MKKAFILFLCFIALGTSLTVQASWHYPLYVGGDGYWQMRIPVELLNNTDKDMAGIPVSIYIGTGNSEIDMAGESAKDIRVCDEAGNEFLFDITHSDGSPAREGIINAGDNLIIPAECKANSKKLYYIYFHNIRAWPVPDFFVAPKNDDGASSNIPEIRIGKKEKMELAVDSDGGKWIKVEDKQYTRRLSLKILNFANKPIDDRLIYARLCFRSKMGNAKPVLADSKGKIKPYILSGDGIMFFGGAPAESIARYNIYLSENETDNRTNLTYENLINNPDNLVKNYSFEDGNELPESWRKGTQENGSRVSPGFFGNYCARLSVGQDDPLGWVGWKQEAPVKPNTSYFYGCYVKTENIQGQVRLHAHFRDADGKLSKEGGYFSTSSSLQGTSDWTLLSSMRRTPADTASVELLLTMDTRGTVWHDGVILCEVAEASTGQIEYMNSEKLTDYRIWQVNPLVKVFQEDFSDQETNEVEISVAQNEKEPIQLAIRSPFMLKDVLVTMLSPENAQGEKLDASIHKIGYVPVDHPSNYYQSDLPSWRRVFPTSAGRTDGWAGWWPDPLMPMEKFDIPANTTQPVWITVSVPKKSSSGEYKGMVRVQTSNGSERSINLKVKVWDFALPDETHLKVIYDLRNGRGWNVMDREKRWAWYKLMAEHRICPGLLPSPSIKYENGQVIMDTKEFDEAASYCLDDLKMSVFYTPGQFYGFGWGYPPRDFQGFKPFTPEYEKAYSDCLKAFMDHLREKGWDKKVVHYISDEPHYQNEGIIPQMQKLCDMIHKVEPDIKIYSSTWGHVPEWDGYLDIWGAGAYGVFPVNEMKERIKNGDEIVFTTDGHMATDTPYCAIERLYPYYCWKYDVSGYEFWGVSWWTYNPFKFGWHSYNRQSSAPGKSESVRYPNGDGFLTYPGWVIGQDGPISSIRLEQVREGLEDYEYMYLLKQNIKTAKEKGLDTTGAEQALAKAEALVTIPNAGGLRSTEIMPDPDAITRIRVQIGEEIEKMLR
jgi:hypothetical protein